MSTDTSKTLLQSLQSADDAQSWEVLDELYRPMIHRWLGRNGVRQDDRDDVVQEVLIRVAQKVQQFQHSGRRGAFRNWLKQITINCLRNHARKRGNRMVGIGGSDFGQFLNDWKDPASHLSRAWRADYHQSVVGYILQVAEKKFRDNVFQAFYRTTILEQSVEQVAIDLDMTHAAIYTARSRVLQTIRKLKDGLVEEDK